MTYLGKTWLVRPEPLQRWLLLQPLARVQGQGWEQAVEAEVGTPEPSMHGHQPQGATRPWVSQPVVLDLMATG